MAKVLLKNLKKSYQNNQIIKNINLEINDGEFIVVLGPSGCGKSTMLRMIAGLEKVTEGEIYIGQTNVTKLEPKDRSIAMVFQNYALYPHMTVYKNIAYGLKLHKVPKAEIEKKVEIAAEMLQLKDLLQRKPNQLSGGQRQRVAMGRAIVREPNVFLFDEPLSNLDAKLRTQMRFEIKNIHRNVKTTSIYVTHDQIEAMTLADRIILLNKGEIEQIGTPNELYESPASTFVGGFIGNPPMNFISGEIANKYLQIDSLNSSKIAGIRPERIQITDKERETNKNECLIPFNIKMCESIGHETLIYGNIENSNTELIVKESSHSFVKNKKINLQILYKDLHLFNATNGKRL
ncbi:ABC transporter ATP-binding protein [Fluviispira multicolorata]|uniref:sn-glycerol-3-phosphate ABC transporter ATP-binding protein UgpC n=1 Tax=Fluviispira multicolorata TaxID=2654512 RepID=A0A833JCY9_9BACT|nr:sn-glycerol-3-phosphate ABC transporter ATP-binding protein UgpC [Fluviispira multicolorata]KAB8030958.1 sn-glycerol-3-phosphate ABC transporter ATP-binding protein UgpC [Fluviispira multicolorata]